MLWTDEMLKAGYPSLRKRIPAAYDPMSTVTVPLTVDDWQAILNQPDITKTKKFRPRLEAMAATRQPADLSVDEWGKIMFALCGSRANQEPRIPQASADACRENRYSSFRGIADRRSTVG